MKSKKANALTDLLVWIVVGFISILFLGVWILGHGLLTDQLNSVPIVVNGANISEVSQDTFGQVNDAMPILHIVALMILFGGMIAIFISNFLVKAHPVFFGVYVLFLIIAVIFSVFISNTYDTLLADATIGQTLRDFRGASFIMNNLPVWVTVIGTIGGILLFSGIPFDREQGGSII